MYSIRGQPKARLTWLPALPDFASSVLHVSVQHAHLYMSQPCPPSSLLLPGSQRQAPCYDSWQQSRAPVTSYTIADARLASGCQQAALDGVEKRQGWEMALGKA